MLFSQLYMQLSQQLSQHKEFEGEELDKKVRSNEHFGEQTMHSYILSCIFFPNNKPQGKFKSYVG